MLIWVDYSGLTNFVKSSVYCSLRLFGCFVLGSSLQKAENVLPVVALNLESVGLAMMRPEDMSSFQLQQRIREVGPMVKSLPAASSGPLVLELHDLCFEYALRLQRIGKEVELPS